MATGNKKIYEVWKSTYMGDWPYGFYTTREEAEKHRDHINAGKSGSDLAQVTEFIVKEKFEPEGK